jgi:hypothetical protein
MKKRNYKRELKKLVRTINARNWDDILVYVQLRVAQTYEYFSAHRDEIKYTTWLRLEKVKKTLEKIELPLNFPYDNLKEFSTKEPEKYQQYLKDKKGIVDAIQLLLFVLVHLD